MRRNVIGLLVSAVLIVALTVPAAAGGMKPFVARSEQVLAVPSAPPTEGRLKEMVDAYEVKANLIAELYFTRDQEEQNNVGGNCTAVAYEALFLYFDKPSDWFMTRTITTANGDEIYQELSGIAYPIGGPGSDLVIDGEWEITGGTGRFLGAVGFGDADGVTDGATFVSVLSKGRISTVGSQRRNR